MKLYTILDGISKPDMHHGDLPKVGVMVRGVQNATLIRGVHHNQRWVSVLYGTVADGFMDIHIFAAPGFENVTSTDPIHHHVSALNADYSAALGGAVFRALSPYNRHFLKQRFPHWLITDGPNKLTQMLLVP